MPNKKELIKALFKLLKSHPNFKILKIIPLYIISSKTGPNTFSLNNKTLSFSNKSFKKTYLKNTWTKCPKNRIEFIKKAYKLPCKKELKFNLNKISKIGNFKFKMFLSIKCKAKITNKE